MNLLDLMVKIGVDDQTSGKIDSIASSIKGKLGDAARTAGKLALAGTAAVASGAAAITVAATNSYAQFEQLEGGVSKLYGDASDEMMRYARNAYRTSGMSMNQYMEQATSFSAALINSLGGDVQKAADQTDKAMRLMSDNVNTFGTDAEAVQNAIQGLSRENFTMIDNLKLGYAGTREGMQQLIADANEYAGLTGTANELTIDSFSDMIDAIDIIQQKQNIWGTTAKEAATTIEGSVNMTRAAWENFLTSLGTGNEDMIRESVGGLVSGIFGTWDDEAGKRVGGIIQNVAPVVARVGAAIVQEIPSLVSTVAFSFGEMIANALGMETGYDESVGELMHRIGVVMANKAPEAIKGLLSDALGAIFGDAGREAVENFFTAFDATPFVETFERLKEAGGTLIDMFIENLPAIGEFLGSALTVVGQLAEAGATVVQLLTPFLPSILAAFTAIKAVGIGTAAVNLITTLGAAMGSIQTFGGAITALVTVLGGPIPIIAAVVAAIVGFIATNEDARTAISNAWQAMGNFISTTLENIKSWVKEKWEQAKEYMTTAVSDAVQSVHKNFLHLKNNVEVIFNTIRQNIANAFETAKQNVIDAATGIYNGVKSKFDSVVSFVQGIPSRIVSAIGDLSSLLLNAGSSIISGLWDGMMSSIGGLYDWVSGIGATIASLKGPIPYDKKLLIDNGLALMSGLQRGLQEGFENEVKPYVSGMGLDVASSISVAPTTTAGTLRAVTVQVGELVVREEADIDRIAERLYDLSNREAAWSMSYSMA